MGIFVQYISPANLPPNQQLSQKIAVSKVRYIDTTTMKGLIILALFGTGAFAAMSNIGEDDESQKAEDRGVWYMYRGHHCFRQGSGGSGNSMSHDMANRGEDDDSQKAEDRGMWYWYRSCKRCKSHYCKRDVSVGSSGGNGGGNGGSMDNGMSN